MNTDSALDALVDDISQTLASIRALCGELATSPDPGGGREKQLLELMARRDALTSDLGRAAVKVIASGGSLRAVGPDGGVPAPTPAPAPAPAAQAPAPAPPEPPTITRRIARPRPAGETAAAPVITRSTAMEPTVDDIPTPRVYVGEDTPLPTRTVEVDRAALTAILKILGPPQRVNNDEQARGMAAALDAATAYCEEWAEQPQEVQHALVGLTSSMARHLQDEYEFMLLGDTREHVVSSFRRLTRFSAKYRPGFVLGLSRKNDPEYGSWLEDAQRWWQGVQETLGPPPEAEPSHVLDELRSYLGAGVEDRKELVKMIRAAFDAGIEQDDPRLVEMFVPHLQLLRGARGIRALREAVKEAVKEVEGEG